MNGDDKEDLTDDAFYKADYDEDTIDYELDTDKLLGDEEFEPKLTPVWGDEEFDAVSELSEESESELDPEPEYDREPLAEPESEEVWYEDDEPEESYLASWPLGLIAVAAIALLLLAAGGYGVIQQRSAMQEEIRQLRAALSTSSSNTEIAASRQAQRALETENGELRTQIKELQLASQGVSEGLNNPESPVNNESTVLVNASTESIAPKPAPVPVTAKRPEDKPIKAPLDKPKTTGNTWFVNFGSYTQEAAANNWAARLKSDEGKIVVVSGKKGSTLYFRVRVIDLPSREIAEKIAHQLEQAHNLPRLWIGKQ